MKILMVCLGNICRSPLAEGILRHRALERGIKLEVDSCGTSSYHIGEQPDPRSMENAGQNGLDISDLRARQFNVPDFDQFDRIYVMDASNLRNVLSMAETEAHRNRVKMILNELEPGSNRSVPDPYFGGEDGFQHVFELLDAACEKILDGIQK